MACKRHWKFPFGRLTKMRRRFFGLLFSCLMFGANASEFACPTFKLRRALPAATAEDALIACFSGETSTPDLSALSERKTSAQHRATKPAPSQIRHPHSRSPSAESQTSKGAEKERPSVGVRDRSDGRSLRQDDGLDDEASPSEIPALFENALLTPVLLVLTDLPCSLSKRTLEEHLNEATRTWRINRSILNDVENDIQVIINCTRPGDVLTFSPRRRIRPSSRVVIPWPLTLTAAVDSSELEEGVFPRSDAKATFTCPNRREGVFLVK